MAALAAAAHASADPALPIAGTLHLVHAAALLGIAALTLQGGPVLAAWAGWGMLAGLVLFCGGIYLRVFAGLTAGPAVPIGGTALILSWLLLSGSALRRR